MEHQEEAKLFTCFFASGFAIKGTHQTGKDRWATTCNVKGKSKPETRAQLRSPLEAAPTSKARSLCRLGWRPGPVTSEKYLAGVGCWRRASGMRVKEAPGASEQVGILRS